MRSVSLLVLLVLLVWAGLVQADPLERGPKDVVDLCLDFGFLTPHGYGANVAFLFDFKPLNEYKPFVAFGLNVITGLTYSVGIEYEIDPRLRLSSLLSVAGGQELGQYHMYWDESSQSTVPRSRPKILLVSGYFDLLKSDHVDLLLGGAIGLANVDTLRGTSDSDVELRFLASPVLSVGLRW